MARRARPWYRSDRGAWYVQLDHKQHNLGITDPQDLAGAIKALQGLISHLGGAAQMIPAAPEPKGPTVAEAVARYLAGLKTRAEAGRITRGHYRNTRIFLDQFARAFGDVQVSRLEADRVDKWVETRPWSMSYQNDAVGAIGALLRAEGVALRLRKPPKESRGADTCLTDEQFEAVIHDLTEPGRHRKRGDLAELLRLLRETGARPGEATGLTVEGIDWENATALLKQHKTRRHTGKARPIYFNSAAMRILHAQRAKYRSGILFRTRNGNPYKPNELWEVLGAVSRRLGFRVVAYGQRHSFATNALEAGVPEALVAELLGQKGTGMISRHYNHVGARASSLKRAAELASRPAQRAQEKCD